MKYWSENGHLRLRRCAEGAESAACRTGLPLPGRGDGRGDRLCRRVIRPSASRACAAAPSRRSWWWASPPRVGHSACAGRARGQRRRRPLAARPKTSPRLTGRCRMSPRGSRPAARSDHRRSRLVFDLLAPAPARLRTPTRAGSPRSLSTASPASPVRVINRTGIAGEESARLWRRIDRDVIADKPDLVIWQVGTNGVLRGEDAGKMGDVVRAGIVEDQGRGHRCHDQEPAIRACDAAAQALPHYAAR